MAFTVRISLVILTLALTLSGRPSVAQEGTGYTVSLRFLQVDTSDSSTGFTVVVFDPMWIGSESGEGVATGRSLDGSDRVAMNYQFTIAGSAEGLKLSGTVHVPGHTPQPVPVEGTLVIGKPGAILQQTLDDNLVMMQATVWLDFSLRDLSGRQVHLSQFRGDPLLLDFWASWCLPCRESLPHTQKLHTSGYRVLAVNVGESRETAQVFLAENGYSIPVVLDTALEVTNLFGVAGLPAFVLIGRDGSVIRQWVGAGHDEEIAAALKAATEGK